ncbi:J domain-containing protein [Persicimonas caeni]|uniref:J domain-containing protein n=1 Tax=Persicimonas caeni TaxID=2292766 RepID=A0A4Y6Q175_PERCE|nr:J domain-containing protein [Persicimonas caeni]QDG53735.1 J domain-containing protein [Persicimonas caeni]QED34956.1 J domain-containing protein [Persicimonas caeni]
MIRILLIGRQAAAWSERLERRAGDDFEFDTARLPAAGLRQFEATPPDALVVIDSASTKRAATLIAAVRERPLGQLIPVIAIAPPPGEAEHAEVDAWLSPNAPVERLVDALEECLGVEFGQADSPRDSSDSNGGPWREKTPARDAPKSFWGDKTPAKQAPEPLKSTNEMPQYFIEEIDDEPFDQPRRLDRSSIFSSPSRRGQERPSEQARVDQEAVERKLKAVRHEDYYAILEIRRGAEGTVVREAFHRLYRRFDPREMDFEVAHRMEDEIGEIRDALEDAWAVLGDPTLRQAYLEHTTRR